MTTPIDYCTLSPDRIGAVDISHCCKLHDIAYETTLTIVAKLQADAALGQCIAAAEDSITLGFAGAIYALATATVGTFFWLKSRFNRKKNNGIQR